MWKMIYGRRSEKSLSTVRILLTSKRNKLRMFDQEALVGVLMASIFSHLGFCGVSPEYWEKNISIHTLLLHFFSWTKAYIYVQCCKRPGSSWTFPCVKSRCFTFTVWGWRCSSAANKSKPETFIMPFKLCAKNTFLWDILIVCSNYDFSYPCEHE